MEMSRFSKKGVSKLVEHLTEGTISHGTRIDAKALGDHAYQCSKRCLLCSKPSYVFGIFIPSRGKAGEVFFLGSSSNHDRTFFYGLCVKCYKLEDRNEAVEDHIKKEVQSQYRRMEALKAHCDQQGLVAEAIVLPDGNRVTQISARDN